MGPAASPAASPLRTASTLPGHALACSAFLVPHAGAPLPALPAARPAIRLPVLPPVRAVVPLPAPPSTERPAGPSASPAVAPLLEQLPLLELDGAAPGHHSSEALSEPCAAAYLCPCAAAAATVHLPLLLTLLRETPSGICLKRLPAAPPPTAEVVWRKPLLLLCLPDSALWLLPLLCCTRGTPRPPLKELPGRRPAGEDIGRKGTEGLKALLSAASPAVATPGSCSASCSASAKEGLLWMKTNCGCRQHQSVSPSQQGRASGLRICQVVVAKIGLEVGFWMLLRCLQAAL